MKLPQGKLEKMARRLNRAMGSDEKDRDEADEGEEGEPEGDDEVL